ncbi:hypothetical protein [Streptomyces echinatus]|uniref:hypothetical protein n=1 Tax=Streptomyces echinatus TaxID=67293 RepID=UPI0037F885CC
MHPAGQLWTPCADGTADHGFIAHQGLFVARIDGGADDDLYPVGFLVLEHQRWADIVEVVAVYMARVHGWRNLHLYPGDTPAALIPRIPRAVLTHGVVTRTPTTAVDASGTRRGGMVWAPSTEPGAVQSTAAASPPPQGSAAGIPDPNCGAPATWAA